MILKLKQEKEEYEHFRLELKELKQKQISLQNMIKKLNEENVLSHIKK